MEYRIIGVRYGRSVRLTFTDLNKARRKAKSMLKGATWLIVEHWKDGVGVEYETFA